MHYHKLFVIASITLLSLVVLVGGLRFWVSKTTLNIDNKVWTSIETCAENQKNLFQSIEAYREENGHLPEILDDFKINGFPATMVWKCPATNRGYDLFLENFGDSDSVVIADKENRHPTSFMLWFRGLTPQVHTMGDGTIHLFEGGKIMTMKGSQKR